MTLKIACAAAAAAFLAFALPAPAQAHMADPGLRTIVPSNVQETHYRPYRHVHRRHHRHHARHRHRHRHCWNERVRVRVAGAHFVWRTKRHCVWRR